MSFIKIEKGTNPNNKPQAVFVAFVTEAPVYKDYSEGDLHGSSKNVPLVLMNHRWDGRIGFAGGMVETGESLWDAVCRETFEELGHVMQKGDAQLVCSHETPKLVTSLYVVKATPEEFKRILLEQGTAEHFLSEGSFFSVHFQNYTTKKPAMDTFMRNQFAPTVVAEINELVTYMEWNDKFNTPNNYEA